MLTPNLTFLLSFLIFLVAYFIISRFVLGKFVGETVELEDEIKKNVEETKKLLSEAENFLREAEKIESRARQEGVEEYRRIIEKANEEAKKIVDSAGAEARRIIEEGAKEIESYKQQIRQQANRIADNLSEEVVNKIIGLVRK